MSTSVKIKERHENIESSLTIYAADTSTDFERKEIHLFSRNLWKMRFALDFTEPSIWLNVLLMLKNPVYDSKLDSLFTNEIVNDHKIVLAQKVYRAQNINTITTQEVVIYFNTETAANVILKVNICTRIRPQTRCPFSVTHKFWQNVLKLSSKSPYYGISTGNYMERVNMQNLAKTVRGTLKVYWIPLIYTSRKHYQVKG